MTPQIEIKALDGPGRICKITQGQLDTLSPCIPTLLIRMKNDVSVVSGEKLRITCFPSKQFLQIGSQEVLRQFLEKYDTEDMFYVLPRDAKASIENIREQINFIENCNESGKLGISVGVEIQELSEYELKDIFSSDLGIVVLNEVGYLQNSPRRLIDYLVKIRKAVSPRTLLYAAGIHPNYFPLLSYTGIDLFDGLVCRILGQQGVKIQRFDPLTISAGMKVTTREKDRQTLIEDNLNYANHRMQEIRASIQTGVLRELVRETSVNYPPITAAMRHLDDQNNFLEVFTPIKRRTPLLCTTEQDLKRPEVCRFINRVIERFEIPEAIEIIIILPCSAKKPYSFSRSHQLFRKAIKRGIGRRYDILQELILTSPLGIVPRELEWTYPAAHYDIPVTGTWSHEEQKQVQRILESVLEKSPHAKIVCHLVTVEKQIVQVACDKLGRDLIITNSTDKLLSTENLNRLTKTLQDLSQDITTPKIATNRPLRRIRSIADYMFSKGIGEKIFPPSVKIKGRSEKGEKIIRDNKVIATFRPTTGFLELSIAGIELFNRNQLPIVQFNGETLKGSSLLCPGVLKADREILIEEEVVITNKNEKKIAVGKAILPGDIMLRMKRGVAVKIREKVNQS